MVRSPNYYIQLWDNQVSLEMATLLMDISAQGSRDDVMTSFKTVSGQLDKEQFSILVVLLGL